MKLTFGDLYLYEAIDLSQWERLYIQPWNAVQK